MSHQPTANKTAAANQQASEDGRKTPALTEPGLQGRNPHFILALNVTQPQ